MASRRTILPLGVCLLTAISTWAVSADLSLLAHQMGGIPEYCQRDLPPERKAYWKKQIKVNVSPTHLCIAVRQLEKIKSGKVDKKGENAKRRMAAKALQGIAYVEKRLPKDHWMMSDIHFAYAEAYRVLGNRSKVSEHEALALSRGGGRGFGHAMQASTAPYVAEADRMMELGLHGEAVELLELARRIDPYSKTIQRKLIRARAAQRSLASDP